MDSYALTALSVCLLLLCTCELLCLVECLCCHSNGSSARCLSTKLYCPKESAQTVATSNGWHDFGMALIVCFYDANVCYLYPVILLFFFTFLYWIDFLHLILSRYVLSVKIIFRFASNVLGGKTGYGAWMGTEHWRWFSSLQQHPGRRLLCVCRHHAVDTIPIRPLPTRQTCHDCRP